MTGLMLALGSLIVAGIEVVVIGALLAVLGSIAYGVVLGFRRSRSSSPARLGAAGVPRQLVERRHGGHRGYGPTYVVFDEAATFDGKPIGARLDSDSAGCDR